MYSLMINHISNDGTNFFSNFVVDTLKDQLSKKIVIVALVALSCLTAIYLAYACYWSKKENKEESSNDLEKDDLSLDSSSLVYEQEESPEKVDNLKEEEVPKLKEQEEPKLVDILENYLFEDEEEERVEELKVESKPVDVKDDSAWVEKPKIAPKRPDLKPEDLLEEQRLIKSIKQRWLDDPRQETQRLKDAAVLHHHLGQTAINKLTQFDKNQISLVIGRVLELRNVYQKTHYVFTHGQATEISVANQLIKELVRNFTPALHHPLKIPFRVPHTVTYTENANDFITKYNATDQSAYEDNRHNAEMISVDAYFWNTDNAESALYFFDANSNINIWGKSGVLLKIFKTIISNYVPDDDTLVTMLAEKACKIANQKKTDTKVGTLYPICVPKSIVQDEKANFAYQCHPFGKKCGCFPTADRIKMLEDLQSDKLLTCTNGLRPQYRLLTSRLTEEKDVRSFAVDALPKERRKFYRDQVKELVAEINQYSYLSDLVEQLADGNPVMDQIQSLIEASPQLDLNYIKRLFAAKELYYQ